MTTDPIHKPYGAADLPKLRDAWNARFVATVEELIRLQAENAALRAKLDTP